MARGSGRRQTACTSLVKRAIGKRKTAGGDEIPGSDNSFFFFFSPLSFSSFFLYAWVLASFPAVGHPCAFVDVPRCCASETTLDLLSFVFRSLAEPDALRVRKFFLVLQGYFPFYYHPPNVLDLNTVPIKLNAK